MKEVDIISFPNLPFANDWKRHGEYQELMHRYANSRDTNVAKIIMHNFSTYQLAYDDAAIHLEFHRPPLSGKEKTFPLIYYRYKNKVQGGKENLPKDFLNLLNQK